MKKQLSLLAILFVAVSLSAQKMVMSGTVVDASTGKPIAQASVNQEGTGLSVVTNEDGFFTLKSDDARQPVVISHIGYRQQRIASPATHQGEPIRLTPATIQLEEVVVWREDPRELVNAAIDKIPSNYSRQAELYGCFYRETAMKRQRFVYVAEGVVDMFKTSYTHSSGRDRVSIRKGRRLLSPKANDTLTVKVMGGPVYPVQLDIVKNLNFLLNRDELANYSFSMEMPEVIEGRTHYVVAISPKTVMPYPLFFGRLYIDRLTLAFRRAELTLDVSDRQKATRFMLVSKPAGVRFRPKELSTLIEYRTGSDGTTRISYIRNTFRFNCDWKRRLLATSFTATCEMVVTDIVPAAGNVRPLSGHKSFDTRDAFFDRVDFFRDPAFWEDYNIIEPTVTLDKAIDRLMKQYRNTP